MSRYVYVVENEIVEGPKQLPKSWKNISGFNYLSDPELKTHGWLPYIVTPVEIDWKTETNDTPIISINQDDVTETQTKRNKTSGEIDSDILSLGETVRAQRNELLRESDWVVVRNLEQPGSIDNILDWTDYRQSLRDIPEQPDFPYEIIWPTKPESELSNE